MDARASAGPIRGRSHPGSHPTVDLLPQPAGMRRVPNEERSGVVVEHREDQPEDLPIGLRAGRPHHELSGEVLQRPELGLTCLGRRGSLDRPPEQDRDEHGEPEEHEQHDDVLGLPDLKVSYGGRKKKLKTTKPRIEVTTPGPIPPIPAAATTTTRNPNPLVSGSMSSRTGRKSGDERERAPDPDRVREELLARPRGPHQPEHVARRPIVLLAHGRTSGSGPSSEASHRNDCGAGPRPNPHGSHTRTPGILTGP